MRRAAVILVALVAAFAPLPRQVVERAYTNGFYLAIQPLVTGLSNRVSIALADVLLVLAAAIVLVLLGAFVRRARREWARSAGDLVLSLAAFGAIFYLWFLVLWGGNYRRVPLRDRLAYDGSQVTSPAVVALARSTAVTLNGLHDRAHAAGWTTAGLIDPGLAGAFAETQRLLGDPKLAVPARPKLSLLQPYFRRTGVAGMTDPFFLETLVDGTLLPFERPEVVAHEWAHLAGYADEGEASFVGWLTCVRAREPEQYSGWLFLYQELAGSTAPRERAMLGAALSDGVRADLRAVADRLRRNINPTLASAGWRAYDRYLKANRVAEGAASYQTVVRLVVGTKFDANWVPRPR